MSDIQEKDNVATTIDQDDIEERRAKRDLKFWLVKLVTSTFMVVFAASMLSLVYAAVVREKDLDTGFLGTVFQSMFEFIRFLMS